MKDTRNNFKSPLEEWTAQKLEEEGIPYKYEPYSVELIPAFSHAFRAFEGKKELKPTSGKVRNMKYTPDFTGDGWIMETKGHKRADFDLRWKLFKYLKKDEDFLLLLPRNRKQVEECISLIKNRKDGTLPQISTGRNGTRGNSENRRRKIPTARPNLNNRSTAGSKTR